MNHKLKKYFRATMMLLIILSNIGCDQVTKHIVRKKIAYHEEINLLNGHVLLTKVENTGAFLSLGQNWPSAVKLIILSLIPLLLLIGGTWFILTRTNYSRILLTGIAFVVGGGIGNIYDRFRYGSVTDFFHIDFMLFRTGIFNMADVSVMVGVLLIMIDRYSGRLLSTLIS